VQQTQTAFDGYPIFFSSLNIPPVTFIFSFAHYLLINAWSLKLIWPIITSLCVLCIAMWKHLASSLWMNVTNFIFWLFHIRNHPTLYVLIPFHLPYTPSVDYAHLFPDCENTFGDYTYFFANCAYNSNDCANTPNDRTNTAADSTYMPNISSINFCIPNPTLLQ
jgi:hypothetical protein